jgi:hypothetical protein
MNDREIMEAELKYTPAEAARAFEWLRRCALAENGHNREAAIMLCEVWKLKERDGYVQGEDSRDAERYRVVRKVGDWSYNMKRAKTPEEFDAAVDSKERV